MSEAAAMDSVPNGWEHERQSLIELRDAAGLARAWVALDYGANCIEYAVLRDGDWQPVLHSADPATLRRLPSRFGCPVLFPFPGHMLGAGYVWRGRRYSMPSNVPSGDRFLHGIAHTRPWRAVEGGPDYLIAELMTTEALSPDEQAGYPFAVRLRQTLRLVRGALEITLEASNEGGESAPVGLGLHPYFDPSLVGGDRTLARIELPGTQMRAGRPVPNGELLPAPAGPVSVPPLGETTLISRTDLGRAGVVTLRGATATPQLVMELLEGVEDLLVFTPVEHASISIEPMSLAPSAASQPEGHPAGLVGLEPGAQRRLAVRLTLQD